MSVVEASLHHLDVVLGDGRFLGKFLAQEVGHEVQVAVEEPADQTQRKHVAALQDGLVVQSRVGQALFHHRGQRALDHAVGVNAHLAQVVVRLKLRLLQVVGAEGVGVDDDCSLRLGVAQLRLQRRGVHRHEHVAQVTRRVHLACSDVHLEAGDARQRALRGADVSGIVGES